MFIQNKPQDTRRDRWLWSFLFALTIFAAALPTSVLIYNVAQHGTLGFILDAPYGKGIERTLLKEIEKDWKNVNPEFRSLWILYRTPISMYLGTLMTCLGPVCCMAARHHWHRDAYFTSLATVTIAVAAFHLWAKNPLADSKNVTLWPFLLFPASVLIPLWIFTLVVENRQRRKANEPISMNGTHAG